MRTFRALVIVVLVLAVIGLAGGLLYVKTTGLRGQPEPGSLETTVARRIRALAIPGDVRTLRNPLAGSQEAMWAGLEHFAKYCAMCHANDGSGRKTAIGRGLYPKPPDLRADATTGLTDGELFYIIDNGVRFTGMPAFGTGERTAAGDKQLWQLVTFVRHLPRITKDETGHMESLNPL